MSKPPAFNPSYPQQGGTQPPPQGYAPPPQGYAAPPQGYAAPPQGQAAPPQGYAAPPQGYGPPPPAYGAAPPQGYAPPPQGYAPPPQGYAPPPQGYAPPPKGYAPPPQQGYAAQPPPGYAHAGPPPPGQPVVHQTNVVVQNQSGLSSSLGGLMKSAGKLASGAVNTLQKEVDLYASGQQLGKFSNDNIVQLISCASNRYLRVLPNGGVDAVGVPTSVDTQFIVVNHGNNIVSLRNLATQNKFLTISGGVLSCTSTGNYQSKFRLHETSKGFVTFESLSDAGCHIGVLPTGAIKQPKLTKTKDASTFFSVTLLYTRNMTTAYPVQQSHTVYQTTVVQRK